MTAERTARRFVVRGLVQGVGFRYFVVQRAADLGLDGWVRNRADGSVEVLAAGGADALDALAELLRRGPRAARVDAVEAADDAAPPPEPGFTVRR